MKKMFLVFVFLGLVASFAFSASDEFSEAASVVGAASSSGKTIVKEAVQWLFALILPIVLIISSAFLAYKFEKQKSEQDKDTSKIYIKMAGASLAGFFVYIAISMLVSRWFFGDFSSIFSKVVYSFFSSMF